MDIRIFVIFLILLTAKCDDDCPTDKSSIATIRLRKHLLCGYDKETRPVQSHKTVITVNMYMFLTYFQYDMNDDSFTIHSWIILMWTDEHLKWTPDEYESIERIYISSSDIWKPDISVYNRRTQGGDPSAVETTNCIVSNDGLVICVPSVSHSTLCTSDLTRYPFDEHNCRVRFGSWVHRGEEMDLKFDKINTERLVPNGEWELVDSNILKHAGNYSCCPNSTFPSTNLIFKIRRRSEAHVASVVFPALALIVITLSSLWISPTNPERLRLCYVNILCEFLYVQYVSLVVPLNGVNVPVLLLFARDSLLISTFTVVFSLILKYLVERESPAPAWISKTVCVVVAFKPGQLLFLKNSPFKVFDNKVVDAASIVSADKTPQNKDCIIFAKILDVLCFVIYIITYVCMLAQFTP